MKKRDRNINVGLIPLSHSVGYIGATSLET